MKNNSSTAPTYFWALAIFFLLWNLMGLLSFYMHTFISDASLALLPKAEQDLYSSYPLWTSIVFALAVLGGFIGSVGLLLKRKWSKMAFVISLGAIIPQMIHNVFITKSMDVYGPVALVMPFLVVVIGVFLVWYVGFCIQKKWLK